jgi:hypothetical protein
VSNWQTPNTYLSEFDFLKVEGDIANSQTAVGLSVGQSMAVIVISRALIALFSTLVAWCGLKWHIGFTIQNRYTWGMRGSYIPLLQVRIRGHFLSYSGMSEEELLLRHYHLLFNLQASPREICLGSNNSKSIPPKEAIANSRRENLIEFHMVRIRVALSILFENVSNGTPLEPLSPFI